MTGDHLAHGRSKAPAGILCVGALNLDTVAIGPVPSAVIAMVSELNRYMPYTEMLVPDEVALAIRAHIAVSGPGHSEQLGGSAFNVARLLTPFLSFLRVGFVGVAGRVGTSHPHAEFFSKTGIEAPLVTLSEAVAAQSIAFSADGDRTIFTSTGANAEAASAFELTFDPIARHMATFRLVHITSFLDEATPVVLAMIVERARELNPSLAVSIDPGHDWVTRPSEGVVRLLAHSSLLHVNATEFDALGRDLAATPADRVAVRIRRLMRNELGRTVVVRRANCVVIYSEDHDGSTLKLEVRNDEVVPPADVIDATGAGDTFTGGLLAVLAAPVLQLHVGVRLGTALGRAKVRQQGPLLPTATRAVAEHVLGAISIERAASGRDSVSEG